MPSLSIDLVAVFIWAVRFLAVAVRKSRRRPGPATRHDASVADNRRVPPCQHLRTYFVPNCRPAWICRCRDCGALVYAVEGD